MIDGLQSDAVLSEGGTVITATHRLARQVRWRHDQARAAAGARAWPSADVLPLDAWLRRTWEAGALRDSRIGSRRLLSDDESRLVWRRALASDGHDGPDTGVILPLVAGGWRLCQAWGIPASALRPAADAEDGRAFARWVEAYQAELERRAWQDSGGLLAALAQAGTEARPGAEGLVGFAGFEPWTPALAGLAAALEAAGTRVASIAPRERGGPRRVVAARDEDDELARAFRWAAGHAGPEAGGAVAIILTNLERDAARARRLGLDVLAPGWQLREPSARPLALAAGRALQDYPIVLCALDLLQLFAAEVTFEQASRMLRSCYVAGAAGERAGRARAELQLRRLPVERVRLPTLIGLLREHASQAAALWSAAAALADPVRARRLSPSQWAAHFTAWLAAAGWAAGRGLASEEYQAAEAWQKLLESFAGTDEVAGRLPLVAALGFLGQLARDRPFEPESAPGAVQVLSLREAEGQDFDALWLCGLTADQWPPPARPHPLIPLALQKAAGMPEASAPTLELHTRRRFEQLLTAAGELVLSWPQEREGTETLPSPLLASPGGECAEEAAVLHPDRERVAASAEAEVVPADPPPALRQEQSLSGGARVLAMQAVCPARAFVEYRLRGAPLEPPARPLDLATRGTIVHRLLERLYRHGECERGLGTIDPGRLRDLFEPLASAVLDDFLPAVEPFLASLRLLETERLWALLQSLRELDAGRPGFTVVTEQPRQVRIGPLALGIRLDRLDRLADGGELVLDYKTGRFDAAGWKRPRLPESQLPLYAVTSHSRGVAVIQLRVPAAQLRGVGADALGIPGIRSPAAFFKEEALDWTATLTRWQLQLENLAGEFAAGDFRVDPADRKWAGDQFAGLTRLHEFLPRSEADEAEEGPDE